MTSFSELGLSERALEAVRRLGYAEPTPVQAGAIPYALEGRDIIAAAKTGTGKTAAFALPSMDRIGRAQKKRGPLMLVVTPTRELAAQIGAVCAEISFSTHHRILTVVGGLSYNPQIDRMRAGVDVLIATPGRLIDLMDRGAVDLSHVEVLVLDEADRMLDMGFLPSVKRICKALPAERQTLLFSATIDDAVESSVGSLLHDPARVEAAHRGDTADTIEQYILRVAHAAKPAALEAVLSVWGANRVIVFARTRGRADSCARRLARRGFAAAAIHSDKSTNQRKRTLDAFAAGDIGVIVATDVLARGIDVSGVDYVVNYDMPTQPEDYVHRIGRTGRAGVPGRAVSFVSPETEPELRAIEKLTHQGIPEIAFEGFDAEQAELEAVARTQRAASRRDPDIVQASKELKARNRRKAKAKAAKQDQKSTNSRTSNQKNGKSTQPQGSSPAEKQAPNASIKRDAKQRSGEKPKQKQKQKQPAAQAAQKPKPKAASTRTRPAKPKRDMRPGRAHRAAVAEQRRRKKM